MAGFHIMNLLPQRQKKSSKLYDSIESLPILTFFQIMKSQDLTLLVKEGTTPDKETLSQVWEKVMEEYYREANPKQYKEQLRKAVKIEQLRNQITLLSVAMTLHSLGYKSGTDVLDELKITEKSVESKINMERTRLNMLIAEMKKEDAENGTKGELNFWKTIATVERGVNRTLDVERISVARWIAIINDLKEHYKELNNGNRVGKNNGNRPHR